MDHNICLDTGHNVVRVTQQIVLKPETQQHVLVATKSLVSLTIKPKAMPINGHCLLAGRRIMGISPNKPLQILVSNFFDRQVYLLKCMIIAQCGTLPEAIHAIDLINQKVPPTENHKLEIHPFDSSAELHLHVSAVHYKPANNKRSQMLRHTVIHNDDTSRLARDWQNEAHLSDKYSAYRDKDFSKLTEFKSMWDENLGGISVAGLRIEFVDKKAQPVYSDPYRAAPKSRELKKIEIKEMLW